MTKYTDFLIGPKKLVQVVDCGWECRNIGLFKIMTGVFDRFLETDLLNQDYFIRINTFDSPSQDKKLNVSNFIEFQTSTSNLEDQNIFPDYIFGNWWHIGLRNFDEFTKEIVDNSAVERIEENKLFWIGHLQGIPQRIKYIDLCKTNPDKLLGETMGWTNFGRVPTKFIPTKEYTKFKYLIDLTGGGCSGRLKLLPFCNRPLFITDRRFWSWSDIELLNQEKHIPIDHDLNNLLEMYDWAENNQELVFRNSKLLLNWCMENFTFKKVCDYAFELVKNAIEMNKKEPIKSTVRKSNIKFDVVVAHYKENLDWINRLNHDLINKIYIYTKSEDVITITNPKVVHKYLPNLGRESQTYLFHCVLHYNEMKKNPNNFVFFVQGSPHGLDDRRIPEWIEQIAESDLKFTKNYRSSSPNDFLNKGRCTNWAGTPTPAKYDVREWCDNFVKKDAKFESIPIFWNACFGVSFERILTSDVSKYSKIIAELDTLNPECGHFCERLWYYIFNMDSAKENSSVMEDCYDFFGGTNGHRHHGVLKLNKNGTIGFYSHPNEKYWEIKNDELILLNSDRKPTSILKRISDKEFVGPYLNENGVTHRLTKIS